MLHHSLSMVFLLVSRRLAPDAEFDYVPTCEMKQPQTVRPSALGGAIAAFPGVRFFQQRGTVAKMLCTYSKRDKFLSFYCYGPL